MEQYTTLYRNLDTLYAEGSPLIISGRAIIKNNANGKIYVQIKFKNISEKIIKGVKISVKAFDTFGTELKGIEGFPYIDIFAKRNDEFGSRGLILLPDQMTRSFEAKCTEIMFTDGSSMSIPADAEWNVIPEQMKLEEKFGIDMANQYRRDTFPGAKFVPDFSGDLWRCACGTINKSSERFCSSCKNEWMKVYGALNSEKLAENLAEYKRAAIEKNEAIRLENERKKAEEERIKAEDKEHFKHILKKIAAVFIVIAVLIVLIASTPTIVRIAKPIVKYNKALNFMENGEYETALELFGELEDYKDSKKQVRNCLRSLIGENLEVGDTFVLGNYFGEIEWIVLEKEGEKVFAITKNCIDCKAYNDINKGISWKDCTLNHWLNNDFLNNHFNLYEQNLILYNDLGEKVTILSVEEVNKYFTNNEDRKVLPSDHAIENGISVGYDGNAWWWLRSTGSYSGSASYVDASGEVNKSGRIVAESFYGIRPAIWIDLSVNE